MLGKTSQVGAIDQLLTKEMDTGLDADYVCTTSAYLYDVDKINYHTVGRRKGWSTLTPEREPLPWQLLFFNLLCAGAEWNFDGILYY